MREPELLLRTSVLCCAPNEKGMRVETSAVSVQRASSSWVKLLPNTCNWQLAVARRSISNVFITCHWWLLLHPLSTCGRSCIEPSAQLRIQIIHSQWNKSSTHTRLLKYCHSRLVCVAPKVKLKTTLDLHLTVALTQARVKFENQYTVRDYTHYTHIYIHTWKNHIGRPHREGWGFDWGGGGRITEKKTESLPLKIPSL